MMEVRRKWSNCSFCLSFLFQNDVSQSDVLLLGQILLLENSRSSNPLLGIYQDATATSAAGLGGKGCVYNQNVEDMIQSTGGMKIDQENLYAAGLFRSFQCSVLG